MVVRLVLLSLFYRLILFLNCLVLLAHFSTPHYSRIDGIGIQKEFLKTGKELYSEGYAFRISPGIFISFHYLFVNFIN